MSVGSGRLGVGELHTPIHCCRGQIRLTATRSAELRSPSCSSQRSVLLNPVGGSRIGRSSENGRMNVNKWPFYHSKCFLWPSGLPRAEPSLSARSIGPTASCSHNRAGQCGHASLYRQPLQYASTVNSSCVIMH